MTVESIVQIAINGVMLSLMYILVSLGLSYIFSMLRIITFAHGEIYMLGSYFTYIFAVQMGLNYFIALVLAIAVMFLIGMGLERVLWHPILDKHMPCLILSLGISLVLSGSVALILGEREKGIPTVFTGVINISGVVFSVERLVMVFASIVLIFGVLYFFRNHKLGQAMRAIALDPETAALQGIPVGRLQTVGFGIGCALAATAGGLMAPIFSIFPTMGLGVMVKAFIVVILGGLGSISGVIIGGFIIGFLDSFSLTLVGNIGNMFGFILFILVLLIRPKGIMGYEA
jgi:branched-chain amino acid transport system permease protein